MTVVYSPHSNFLNNRSHLDEAHMPRNAQMRVKKKENNTTPGEPGMSLPAWGQIFWKIDFVETLALANQKKNTLIIQINMLYQK